MMPLRRLMAVSFVCLMPLSAASAGEAYYLLMFGSQRVPSNPNYSHSFATFVRATWPGDGPPQNVTLEEHTISWLPVSMRVRTHALLPECGHNVGLHETLRWCCCDNMRVSMWGPYRICPELYDLALLQIDRLNSGQVRYKANDGGRRSDRVSNCIHAVSTVIQGPRLRVLSPAWGEAASFSILRRFETFIVVSAGVHTWVSSALGLDEHPIIYRDFQRPFSGFVGPAFRLLGGERNLRATYGPPSRYPPVLGP